MRRKISEIENRKTLKKNNNKTKTWFFEKTNKIDEPLAYIILKH